MVRRAYVPEIHIGQNRLPPESAHHVRDVLRMGCGDEVALFTQAGATAMGRLVSVEAGGVVVAVEAMAARPEGAAVEITVAAALPKGERADWMVEKLCELGVARFIPLAAERSVVLPGGVNKLERWRRIAVEAARQSGRAGVMRVEGLRETAAVLGDAGGMGAELVAYLSTGAGARPLARWCGEAAIQRAVLFVGPEGGWTAGEMERFEAAGVAAAGLTGTVLRVETAAVAAAAVVACGVERV